MSKTILFDEFNSDCRWVDSKEDGWYCLHVDNRGQCCDAYGCPQVEPIENEEDMTLQYCIPK